jgi:TFIIF-interacting CTD phosphatase-like protein
MAGILHPEIFYQIEPFHGDEHDRKLLRLIDFLKAMEKE